MHFINITLFSPRALPYSSKKPVPPFITAHLHGKLDNDLITGSRPVMVFPLYCSIENRTRVMLSTKVE